jgi:hypothetical protein
MVLPESGLAMDTQQDLLPELYEGKTDQSKEPDRN